MDNDVHDVNTDDLLSDLDGDEVLEQNAAEGILLEPPTTETILQIQRWLQPTDYAADSSEYKKHLNSYVAGTVNWIQETENYQLWHDTAESSVYKGPSLEQANRSFQPFSFLNLPSLKKFPCSTSFRQIIANNHDARFLVRYWLSRLVPYSPSLQSKLTRDVDIQRNVDISIDDFWYSLLSGMASVPKLYCVVNALDEMYIAKLGFLNRLMELGQQQDSTVKVLMTTRPLPHIEAVLRTPWVL
ncbi:unnamed protein product [Calypogeia fissa]